MQPGPDIAAGRLSAEELAANFADLHPPLTRQEAAVDASRCYFCHDAPCVEACPTAIDVPGFIRSIATGNLRGAALGILEANILGGSCARVCPTEILCEQACVRNLEQEQPIQIGALQRHATDWLMEHDATPFARGALTGKRVVIVGAGPAGLACAHRLARHGHDITILEARAKPGGLNEYGVAAYKLTDDFAQREVTFVLSIGGISVEHGRVLGRDIQLGDLLARYDAVFLAVGQAGTRRLDLPYGRLQGVQEAVAFIAALRQAPDRGQIAVGRRVVVIGGGNTAADAAVQARRLGAEDVTIVYRRDIARMAATVKERAWAKANDVRIRDGLAPVRFQGWNGRVTGVLFGRTDPRTGIAAQDAATLMIEADMVLTAIGQIMLPDPLPALTIKAGRIVVDAGGRTSVPRVYAGGDCVAGPDLTVNAVRDGQVAAEAMHRDLMGR